MTSVISKTVVSITWSEAVMSNYVGIRRLMSVAYLLAAITGTFGLASCNKSEETIVGSAGGTRGWWSLTTGTAPANVYGYLVASVDRSAGISDGVELYHTAGGVYSTPQQTQRIDGGLAVISNKQVNAGANLAYETSGETSAGSPSFGTTSTFSITGNSSYGIPAVSSQIYIPQVIKMLTPATGGATVSKAVGTAITWNPDPQNDSIAVGFLYNGVTSHEKDSTLSATDSTWVRFVPDNGAYQVTSADLAGVPVGGYVHIRIGRGNTMLAGSSHQFYFYAYTTAGATFKAAL